MTDAKQALEVVGRLREGAGRVARHCMRQAEPGDPALISIPRHERDIDAIMESAADTITRLQAELAEARDQDRWIIRMAEIREASGVGHKPMLADRKSTRCGLKQRPPSNA